MARSRTIKHTEKPGTSSLLNAFLLIAFGLLLLSMFLAETDADAAQTSQAELVFSL